jgi:hypothetical protein
MRILVGCFVFLALAAGAPQNSSELRLHYGKPDIERFLVRPEIGLTVEYGSDGLACQMEIRPLRPLLYGIIQADKVISDKLMSVDTMDEILNEVVPPATRGAKIRDEGGFQSGSTYESGVSYDNVTIMHVRHGCDVLQPNCEVGASVTFKRPVCENLSK